MQPNVLPSSLWEVESFERGRDCPQNSHTALGGTGMRRGRAEIEEAALQTLEGSRQLGPDPR